MAELALAASPPLSGEALYHAQQGAEKALKGFLVFSGAAYPVTHDLRKLLRQCEEIDAEFTATLRPAMRLTQFAVRFRYPGEDQPTREEALPWLELARLVPDQVTMRLPAL
jgi:HEPN domain-containing protein